MRRGMRAILVAAPLCILLAAGAPFGPSDHGEVARIQRHLADVSQALRSAPDGHLTQEQRRARRVTLDWLDEYRAAGIFPHNHVRPGQRVSVFVDPHGTPCAVGYLMLRSGYDNLVESIVRTDNLIRVPDLQDDARVGAWLDAHGLTLAEAALIQPTYGPPPEPRGYKLATLGLSVATGTVASYMVRSAPQSGAPWADVLAVGTAMGHTYMILNANDTAVDEPTWAVGLNVVGLVASVSSEVFRLARRGAPRDGINEAAAVQTYVAPGLNGTEIGFAIRH